MTFPRFRYMRWAKEREAMRGLHLCTSGLPHLSVEGVDLLDPPLELRPTAGYGRRDLLEAVARRYGVDPSEVFLSPGSSSANYILLAVLLERGDEVWVEAPAYEVLAHLPALFGARVRRFERTFEGRFGLPWAELEALPADRTRLLLLTSPHNPSGAVLDDGDLRRLARLAEEKDLWVLVDEVYLDLEPPGRRQSARGAGPRMLATNSLTKSFGLGGLRMGWALAPARVVRSCHDYQDLLSVLCPEPVMDLAARFLAGADERLEQARAALDANREAVDRWVAEEEGLSWVRPPSAAFGFPRIEGGDGDRLAERLEEAYRTYVVPGSFFDGMTDFFRIGFAQKPDRLARGLGNVSAALREIRT